MILFEDIEKRYLFVLVSRQEMFSLGFRQGGG